MELRFQAPPLLEWGRVYVEEVHGRGGGGEEGQETAGVRALSFVLSFETPTHGVNAG